MRRLCQRQRELIDTLWNVNVFYAMMMANIKIRINRYIMECKYTIALCLALRSVN